VKCERKYAIRGPRFTKDDINIRFEDATNWPEKEKQVDEEQEDVCAPCLVPGA
jgi:hypothetical protein